MGMLHRHFIPLISQNNIVSCFSLLQERREGAERVSDESEGGREASNWGSQHKPRESGSEVMLIAMSQDWPLE